MFPPKKYNRPTKVKNSYGIILIKKVDNVYKSLLIKKRTTHAFSEFVLSKLQYADDGKIMNILNNMSFEEKLDVISLNFGQIWYRFCLINPELLLDRQKIDEKNLAIYLRCKAEYEAAFLRDGGKRLENLVSRSRHCSTNWEIPRGRKSGGLIGDKAEQDITCSMREVYEETGLKYGDYEFVGYEQLMQTINTFKVQYNNFYFIAECLIDAVKNPKIIRKVKEIPEIIDLKWMSPVEMKMLGVDNVLIDLTKSAISKVKKKYKQTTIYNIQS